MRFLTLLTDELKSVLANPSQQINEIVIEEKVVLCLQKAILSGEYILPENINSVLEDINEKLTRLSSDDLVLPQKNTRDLFAKLTKKYFDPFNTLFLDTQKNLDLYLKGKKRNAYRHQEVSIL